MPTANPVFTDALSLPPHQRQELAHLLLDSLPEVDQNEPVELDEEWEAEIERRIESIRNGTAKPYSADESIARLRAAIQRPLRP